MEPIYLNLCTLHEKNLCDVNRYRRSTATRVWIILGAIYFLGVTVGAFFYGGIALYFGIATAILTVLYFVFVLFSPLLDAKKKVKKDKKRYGDVLHMRYAFYEDGFVVDCPTNGKNAKLTYGTVSLFREGKRVFLLRVGTNVFPVAKNGFRRGSAEPFAAFLREKINAAD